VLTTFLNNKTLAKELLKTNQTFHDLTSKFKKTTMPKGFPLEARLITIICGRQYIIYVSFLSSSVVDYNLLWLIIIPSG
jgi:hypothetical protein